MSRFLTYPAFWHNRSLLAYLLLPLSLIYIILTYLRLIFAKQVTLPGKVICVGNFTIGGTGKTQFVIWLAKKLIEKNIEYVILSKGYGGKFNEPQLVDVNADPKIVGDEALELAHYGRTIIAKKPAQAIALLQHLSPAIIIVDDGMQNPTFHKDFIIATIDTLRGFGNNLIFPAGPLRQKPDNSNIDAIISIGPQQTSTQFDDAKNYKAQINKAKHCSIDPTKQYVAFTGIGNPDKFFLSLQANGITLNDKISFPDHYQYKEEDLEFLLSIAKKNQSTLITTNKDYVKLQKNNYATKITCFEVELVVDNEQELLKLIDEKIFSPH